MKAFEQAVYRFGEFVLLPGERQLLFRGEPVALAGKAFDLLVVMVGSAGHLLGKDQLLQRVWLGLVVEEVNLSVNISAIRKVLARAPDGAEWIETVPRQGYRFRAPVELQDIATFHVAHAGANAGLPGAPEQDPGDATRAWRARRRAWLVAAPVALGVLAWGGHEWLRRATAYPSVAVLPIATDRPAHAYLADGVAEGVIHALTPVRDLRVVPRASAFRFRGAAADPVAAGRQLDASAVVTGSLGLRDGRWHLQLELIDVARRAQVWSSAYELAAEDLPGLQGRLAHDLLRALGAEPASGRDAVVAQPATANGEAYQDYLQGRFLWNQRSEAGLLRSIALFTRAIELDPRFALAHAALADAYTTLGYLGHGAPTATFAAGRPHALRALELDPALAAAHASLAYIRFYFDWDWAGAREEFRRALVLNPADPVTHQWHAVYLLAAGHPDEAFREVRAAQQLDPLSLAINTDIGFHHYYNGRYREAERQLQAVLGMKHDFLLAHLWLARSYLEMGRLDDALAATLKAEDGAREWPVLVAARGYTHGIAGRPADARAVLQEMRKLAGHRFVTAYGVALVHAGLGEQEAAFAWLEKAFAERSHWLVWLRLDPRWKALRGDARFAALVRRMKYPA